MAALRTCADPPARTLPPATKRTHTTSTTAVTTHRMAAYDSGAMSRVPTRSTAL